MSGLELPFRIVRSAPTEPVLSVDGALDAPGLELSHWPGHRTPKDLWHELSTGSALRFMDLSPEERAPHLDALTAIVNNHVDTDGVCALFALLRPDEALPRREALLDTARAGDFFQPLNERAFAVERVLNHLFTDDSSPWRAEWSDLEETERWTRMSLRAVEILPALLDGDFGSRAEIAQSRLERWREDRARLAAARRDDLVHFDLAVFTGTGGATLEERFDPGRHALFAEDPRDRVAALGEGPDGTTCRFIVSTLSWFDIERDGQPRPDLERLRAKLQQLEDAEAGSSSDSAAPCWRAQPKDGASPELWFGLDEHPSFAEHAANVLRPSRLSSNVIRRELIEAVRETFTFE